MPPLAKGTGRAFAPAHITGFFEIHAHDDPCRMGSTGCGIVLDGGVETTVVVDGSMDRTMVKLNGSIVEDGAIHTVITMLSDAAVMVESTTGVPIGCGFGTSGAGALGVAYALNRALSLNQTAEQLTGIAHVAEVMNGSGLGDVVAQSHGGVVMRTRAGASAFGEISRIPASEQKVLCIVLGQIPTKSVLDNARTVRQINSAGRDALKALLRAPTVGNFMLQSREFAIGTGLVSERALDIIETVETVGGMASQAMLGDAVFTIAPVSGENKMREVMGEFGRVLEYSISSCGPKLV
ncbi:MAG TPA: pantothenate kinase [Methanosarcinaceae archaeon]|nr:pantothenate kinase [Methanosarcinaceae archaeon]